MMLTVDRLVTHVCIHCEINRHSTFCKQYFKKYQQGES